MNKKLNKKWLLPSCLTRKEAAQLLHKELDNYEIIYMKHLRSSGAIAIVMAAGSGIIHYQDSNLLSANKGPISITKVWAKSLLSRIHLVKRCATTTKPKMSLIDFEEDKVQFLYDMKVFIEMEEISDSLQFSHI